MIICTKCGTKNPDDSSACQKCGKKLQSTRSVKEEKPRRPKLEEEIRFSFWAKCAQGKQRFIEAWAYVAIVVGVSYLSVSKEVYWPIYVVVALAFILAKLRL